MYFSVKMSRSLFYQLQVTSSGTPYNNIIITEDFPCKLKRRI